MSPENTQEPNGRSDPGEAVQALQEKAQAALSDAEVLLEHGSPEATINRGYYSVFQAARAALLTKGESPETHSGVIRRFGYHFVRTGKVSDEVGSILTTAQSTEGEVDYEAFSDFGREEADELVGKARRFIEAVEEQVLRDR